MSARLSCLRSLVVRRSLSVRPMVAARVPTAVFSRSYGVGMGIGGMGLGADFDANGVKTSTNLTGLAAEPNAPQLLARVYEETLVAVKELPECFFRSEVEHTVQERQALLASADGDARKFEAALGDSRQIEEVLADAKEQLDFIPELVASGAVRDVNADVEVVVLPEGVHSIDRLKRREKQEE
eukprot:TRINITY_DN5390_c0_g3_i1.p2 TRINITY_DN5390_c0_g3~~TRINITY_DN5390_c0_g3_i1.p2  ORF type:complete len:197 (-),score=89.53 TRINITY_DN5390_c0_g3_i1:39-587(-)